MIQGNLALKLEEFEEDYCDLHLVDPIRDLSYKLGVWEFSNGVNIMRMLITINTKGECEMNKPVRLKSRIWKRASVLTVMFLLCGWMGIGLAQGNKVDINALTQETQKMSEKADEMTLVWWIPEEFWGVSFAQDPTVTKSQTEEFLKLLRPYTLIVVADGKMGAFGGVTYKFEADIRADIKITDNQGTDYLPLSNYKVSADAKNFLSMMKPVFVNMLGPMGQNMHFVVFPARNQKGEKIADANKDGAFSVKLGKREFRWRLPLGSLLPAKICPKCGEKLSGAYKFCPWDGTKLP